MIEPGATILLSGQCTGLPDCGYAAARACADRLTAQGYTVLSFAEHDLGTDAPYAAYMRLALTRLLAADAVVLLPGWQHSRGACIEVAAALALALPVYLAGYLKRPLNVAMDQHPVVLGFQRGG